MTRMEIGWMLDVDKKSEILMNGDVRIPIVMSTTGIKMPTFLQSADEMTSKVFGILSC